MSGDIAAAHTILLVEDNDTIREAFTILLEDSGYRVVQAANGAAALHSTERDPPPHLILMDLGLPDVDGLDLVRTLAGRAGTAPIVALTGRALETDQAACIAAGCAGYVTKPVNTEELLRLIATFLSAG